MKKLFELIKTSADAIESKKVVVITPNYITYYGIKAMISHITGVQTFHHIIAAEREEVLPIDVSMNIAIIDAELASATTIMNLVERYRSSTAAMILTRTRTDKVIQQLRLAGIRAVINKDITKLELEVVITSVLDEQSWGVRDSNAFKKDDCFYSEYSSPSANEEAMFSLTATERLIIHDIYHGKTVTDIATARSKSIKTISGQKQAAMRKLNVRNLAELHLRYQNCFE